MQSPDHLVAGMHVRSKAAVNACSACFNGFMSKVWPVNEHVSSRLSRALVLAVFVQLLQG